MYIHACKCAIFDLVVHSSNARCKRPQAVESNNLTLAAVAPLAPGAPAGAGSGAEAGLPQHPPLSSLQLRGTGLPGGCSSPMLRGRLREKVAPSSLRGHPSTGELGGSSNLTSLGYSSLPGLSLWGFKEHLFLTAGRSSPPGPISLYLQATWVCSPWVADQETPSSGAPCSVPGCPPALAPGDRHQAKATRATSACTLFIKGQVLNMLCSGIYELSR